MENRNRWNTWRASNKRFPQPYYGVLAPNVDIHMYDFVFKVNKVNDVTKFYKGVEVDEKSLIIWHLKWEDFAPRRKSPETLKIHPEPPLRKKRNAIQDKKSPLSDGSGDKKSGEKAEVDSPKTLNVAKLREKMALLRERQAQAMLAEQTGAALEPTEQPIPGVKSENSEAKSVGKSEETVDQPEEEPIMVKAEEEVTLISRSEVRRRKIPQYQKPDVTVISRSGRLLRPYTMPLVSRALPRARLPIGYRRSSLTVPTPPILIDDIVEVDSLSRSSRAERLQERRRKERERKRREFRLKERMQLKEKERKDKQRELQLQMELKREKELRREKEKELENVLLKEKERQREQSAIHKEMKRRRNEQKLQRKLEREQRRINRKARKLRRARGNITKKDRKDNACKGSNENSSPRKHEKQKEDAPLIVIPRGRGAVHFRHSSPSLSVSSRGALSTPSLSPSRSAPSQSSVSPVKLDQPRRARNPFDLASDIMNRPVKEVKKHSVVPYQSSSTRSEEPGSQSNARSAAKQTSSSESSSERSLSRVRNPFDSPRNRVRNPFDSPRNRRSESSGSSRRKRLPSPDNLRRADRSQRKRPRLRN